MRFKIDENLPAEVRSLLRQAGFDALSVRDQGLTGTSDPRLFGVCQDEGRILVTLDVGFGRIARYPPGANRGIVVFRLVRQDKFRVLERVRALIPLLRERSPERQLWIVEENRIRIRR